MNPPEISDAVVPRTLAQQLVAPEVETPAPKKRRGRGWLVALAALGILLLAGGAVAAFFLFTGPRGPQPSDAVLDYDAAYAEHNCDLFFAVTTVLYRETVAPTCGAFDEEVRNFAARFSDYVVTITSTEIVGATATVTTTETWLLDGGEGTADYAYALVWSDEAWKIDGLEAIGATDTPE